MSDQQFRRRNGRFAKRKVVDKETKCVNLMNEAKNIIEPDSSVRPAVCQGQRVVTITELAKNLKCSKCKNILDLNNIISEERAGLYSVLTIVCKDCQIEVKVPTGKTVKIDGRSYAEHNLGFIMGSIHSGTGSTGLQKILACANTPIMSSDLYKRYEKVIGKFIDEEAKDSCRRAAAEERHLVLNNVEKICKEMPPDVVVDIYPYLDRLRTLHIPQSPLNAHQPIDENAPNEGFDTALGNIGSAKSMKADAGVALITNSLILKENHLNVKVIIGDEDSSMIASVRKTNKDATFHKLADKNHLSKNFSNELYIIDKTRKEIMRKGVIPHIKKCFNYAIAQNKGNSSQLASVLRMIPGHLYGQHENCTEWCNRRNNLSKQMVKLTDEALYNDLKVLFDMYANNAQKFSVAASSQGNESINNMIAHKAPKNICLSRSAACDYRVVSAVCTKNDGDKSIINIREKMNLLGGPHTATYMNGIDRKRKLRAFLDSTRLKKLRRIELKVKREALRKSAEKLEGVQYLSNCGINHTLEKEKVVNKISADNSIIVYFDLETSSLRIDCDILQISAISGERTFNVYILPQQEIDL
ncbi:uncharacterized protein [Prorops nasuta]|uniref:uncharacterized protein n=1 Tax=Prorops nasuta TaxID=863751 RepID=UPI0034CFA9F4